MISGGAVIADESQVDVCAVLFGWRQSCIDVFDADMMLKECRRVLCPEAVAAWQAEVAGMTATRAEEIAAFFNAFVGVGSLLLSPHRMRIVTRRLVPDPMACLRNIVLVEIVRYPGAALAGGLTPTCVVPSTWNSAVAYGGPKVQSDRIV